LESIPYTFFAYSSGFSFGPTVAELHGNRTLGFILQFAPEILSVAVIFGVLLLVGVAGSYKLFGAKAGNFCLLGLALPIAGALLYALAPRATYNVRYSIVGFPYFCILVGTGLIVVLQSYRAAGVAFCLGILIIVSMSLTNHFFNSRYAKEDIRSAVALWRAQSNGGPLLSFHAQYVLSFYLKESEKERHSWLGPDVVSDVELFFSKSNSPFVYVLFARDWGKLKEKSIKDVYSVNFEKSYPGVKVLKISNSR
jgi:hypothetical protein